jgi:tetratricopeptide (TPR) repeat protein
MTLGNALLAKANSMAADLRRIAVCDEALALYSEEGDALATLKALAAKASAFVEQGHEQEADTLWADVDSRIEHLADAGRSDLIELKATILLNRAIGTPSLQARLELADTAADIFSELVRNRGRYELAGELGMAAFLAGQAYEHTGHPQEAVQAYGRARDALEQAVVRDGRFDLADELALAFDHEATLIRALGDPATAVCLGMKAVEMWRRLVASEGEGFWVRNLATACQKLAASFDEAGYEEAALAELDEALRLFQSLDDTTSHEDRRRLAAVYLTRGVILRRGGEADAAIEAYTNQWC